jgi:hypothetical protein
MSTVCLKSRLQGFKASSCPAVFIASRRHMYKITTIGLAIMKPPPAAPYQSTFGANTLLTISEHPSNQRTSIKNDYAKQKQPIQTSEKEQRPTVPPSQHSGGFVCCLRCEDDFNFHVALGILTESKSSPEAGAR